MANNKVVLSNGTTIIDLTDATATADKILSPYTAYGADGYKMVGTASGSSGFEYESGIWQPTADIARGEITFSKTHTEAPFLVVLADVTGTAHSATNSNYLFAYFDPYKAFDKTGFPYTSSGFRYAVAYYSYRASSTTAITSSAFTIENNSDTTGSTQANYPRYWASPTNFHPGSNSTSRYWRAGRTYKWYAIWK